MRDNIICVVKARGPSVQYNPKILFWTLQLSQQVRRLIMSTQKQHAKKTWLNMTDEERTKFREEARHNKELLRKNQQGEASSTSKQVQPSEVPVERDMTTSTASDKNQQITISHTLYR
jgi:NADPH-dependent ferric siderophore reductase